VDGNDAWWNHSGHFPIGFRSLMTSTENPRGWTGVFPLSNGMSNGMRIGSIGFVPLEDTIAILH